MKRQTPDGLAGPKMIFNRFTLAFPGKDEAMFRERYLRESIVQFRIAFVLVTLLYGVFGYLDNLMVPGHAELFHTIRYFIVIPLLITVLFLSFTRFFKIVWQQLMLLSVIVGGTGISIMLMLAPENYAYYAGLMLVFSACYFFIKLRFLLATIAGWSILLIFNIGTVFYTDTQGIQLLSYNFFFVSANLIGMFAAYNIEFFTRRSFFLNGKLDGEKLLIEEYNRNLENTVAERTVELVKARNKAEESDRLKSAFLANMSHEIRTPMNGILGFANLLKEPGLESGKMREYLGIIEKSGIRMLNIINDIVDISKIEAGLTKVDYTETNINGQLEYTCSFFRPEAEAKGLTLSLTKTLPLHESIVITDREKVLAISANLLKNAIKYTDHGHIELGCDRMDDYLLFYVKDTGIGIPADRQEAIFERFIQADIDDKMARQGAGLGLAISRSYVEMLGGRIWLDSRGKSGSVFFFTIPFNVSSDIELKSDTSDSNVSSREGPEMPKLKILIVDDDETSEMLLSINALAFSREILKAHTGIEAVEICRSNPELDLILMDILMPEMSGYEATRQIRQFNKSVIIIAQTAYALSGDRSRALDAGCNDYITKPIQKSKLLDLVNKYFSGIRINAGN